MSHETNGRLSDELPGAVVTTVRGTTSLQESNIASSFIPTTRGVSSQKSREWHWLLSSYISQTDIHTWSVFTNTMYYRYCRYCISRNFRWWVKIWLSMVISFQYIALYPLEAILGTVQPSDRTLILCLHSHALVFRKQFWHFTPSLLPFQSMQFLVCVGTSC